MADAKQPAATADRNTAGQNNAGQNSGNDPSEKTFDVVIIGAGPGGYATALRAAELGKSVALVEEDARPGGTCLNEGCIPSKALLQTAHELREARRASRMGIDLRLQALDLSRMLSFKNNVVATQVTGLEGLLAARKVSVFQAFGQAHKDLSVTLLPSQKAREGKQGTFAPDPDGDDDPFGSPQISHVIDKETVIHGRNIVLATGSRPRTLPGADFSEHAVLDSRAALSLRQIPQSVIIIGSGAIGTEFASLWNGLGTRVTLLEAAPRIMPSFARRLSAYETREMRRAGITIQTGVRITSVKEGSNQLATVRYDDTQPAGPSLRPQGAITPTDPNNPSRTNNPTTSPAQPSSSVKAADAEGKNSAHSHEISAQFVLVSIGRMPNTDMQWLKDLGVRTDNRGFIPTDPYGRTNINHVWALGDMTPGKMLAHRAFAQGLVVAESIAGVSTKPVDDMAVPAVSYALGQVAQVGWDRDQAQKSGKFADVQEKSCPTGGNSRVVMEGQQGVVTIISGYPADSNGNRQGERVVLGVQMIGPMVSELAGEAEELVGNRIPLHEAARLVHPHPTFSETLGEALLAADGRPLHTR